MKRILSEQEKQAIIKVARKFGDDSQSGRTMEYWQGYGSGGALGYQSGYTACAESSVPIEIFREVVAALTDAMEYLPDLKSEWAWKQNTIPKNDREYSELSTCISSAQEIINKAKTYLPNE